jgi:hypothetical protein
MFVPEGARFADLPALPEGADAASAINNAVKAIEAENGELGRFAENVQACRKWHARRITARFECHPDEHGGGYVKWNHTSRTVVFGQSKRQREASQFSRRGWS